MTAIDGPNLLSPPAVPSELKAMGFKLVSHANNHAHRRQDGAQFRLAQISQGQLKYVEKTHVKKDVG